MANYRLSKAAEIDTSLIYEYGILNFGFQQSKKYLTDLHKTLKTLASNPEIGKLVEDFHPKLRMFPFQSHSIFFFTKSDHIFIVRILNQNMNYPEHFI